MGVTREILKENPKFLIIGALVAMLIAAGAYLRWDYVNTEDTNNINPSGYEYVEEQEEESVHTEAQVSLINSYSITELNFIDVLQSGIWVCEADTNFLTFEDGMWFENAEDIGTPFALQALNIENVELSIITTESATTASEVFTASVLTDRQTHILEMTSHVLPAPEEQGGTCFTFEIRSSAFRSSGIYRHTIPDGTLVIEGDTESLVSLIGAEQLEEVKLGLTSFVSNRFPTATTATFSEVLEIDFAEDIFQTSFYLNDRRSTEIVISYDKSSNAFHIADSRFSQYGRGQ